MSSPRSMWTGVVQVGLISFPVTIGKAFTEEREKALRDICKTHLAPVDRSERCSADHSCALQKVKGVETSSGWRPLDEGEYAAIEAATKSDTLEIIDVQKLSDLEFPLMMTTGTYYLRANEKAKGPSENLFATLALALAKSDVGIIVKWSSSSRQRFGILSAYGGLIVMRTIPSATEIRMPGEKERLHFSQTTDDESVDRLSSLLEMMGDPEGFTHSKLVDTGLALRQAAVEKILAADEGEEIPEAEKVEEKVEAQTNILAMIEASMAAAKQEA